MLQYVKAVQNWQIYRLLLTRFCSAISGSGRATSYDTNSKKLHFDLVEKNVKALARDAVFPAKVLLAYSEQLPGSICVHNIA